MPSAKSIILKRINVLQSVSAYGKILRSGLLFTALCGSATAFSQDNSPYSRFGLGDIVPQTNINMRGMGGVAAAYVDPYGTSINFTNPATYGSFWALKTANSRKIDQGRAVLDIGLNFENRTLQEPNTVTKFRASNALFSHVQVGVPLKPNWGLSFGIRPLTRVSYKQINAYRSGIDSTVDLNEGDGGSYLGTIGTGAKFKLNAKNHISIGANGGYLFGKKENSRRRSIINDSLSYTSGNYETNLSYGGLYFNMGLQYEMLLNTTKQVYLTIGAYGNVKQTIKASTDNIIETYYYDESIGYPRIDSVSDHLDQKGDIVWPSSITGGIMLEKRFNGLKEASWKIGVDVGQAKWSEYRSYGLSDANVTDKWEVKIGGEISPIPNKNYFSRIAYRAGVNFGPDYLRIVGRELPMFGATLGMGLPVGNYSPQGRTQATFVNLAFEYIKRGNNDSPLKENMFRISAGFSLSDIWFVKRKYE
ncbi:MAG: hypothetical protein EOO05_01780 [Chitinophagaceae bacterium]|nr:MAG: hypothetical protein EOO05_01780 [Chitinophagaceae bacterium]